MPRLQLHAAVTFCRLDSGIAKNCLSRERQTYGRTAGETNCKLAVAVEWKVRPCERADCPFSLRLFLALEWLCVVAMAWCELARKEKDAWPDATDGRDGMDS